MKKFVLEVTSKGDMLKSNMKLEVENLELEEIEKCVTNSMVALISQIAEGSKIDKSEAFKRFGKLLIRIGELDTELNQNKLN